MPSVLTERPSRRKTLHICALPRRGKLAGGEVGPGEVNKQGGKSIGLTRDRPTSVAWPEKDAAMAGGETVVVRPPQLGFRRNADGARPLSVRVSGTAIRVP
jgi:hypothetical protein